MEEKRLVVVGAGASGLMASIIAAEKGIKTILIEKNEKTGKKLYITGKGRCNVTNACDANDFFMNVTSNAKFLYSSIYGFDSYRTMDFFEESGLKLKVERGNRVFPESDKSSDVIKALTNRAKKSGVDIMLNTEVTGINVEAGRFVSVTLNDKTQIEADVCFIATGGISYPSTGSTGDGYKFAKDTGHKVTRLLPSLVSVKTKEEFVKRLEGLSLKNVVLSAKENNRLIYSDMGEMLFTHDGISGPLVLTFSSLCTDKINMSDDLKLLIDLKPALSEEQLDQRILRDFNEFSNRMFSNALDKLLPSKIIPIVVELTGINPLKRVNEITKEERQKLITCIKEFPLTSVRLGGYNEAVVTKGGVSVKDINPSTLESKYIKGLHFIGEVLDVDAFTGGFNLQIAWATGYTAAASI